MSEKRVNLSEHEVFNVGSVSSMKVGIVTSEWNGSITGPLLKGAYGTLREYGVAKSHILSVKVPGSYELPLGADLLLRKFPALDAVICLGCVIQGETRHFEFISQAVARGVMDVGLKYHRPVIFGVLTCDTMQQASDRAGGARGNKGVEAAVACVKMLDLQHNELKNAELEAIVGLHADSTHLPIEELMKGMAPRGGARSKLPIEEYRRGNGKSDIPASELKSMAKDDCLPIEELLS